MKVLKCRNEISQQTELKEQIRKWDHLSIYHVYSKFYGHYNVKNSLFFIFFADHSKEVVTVWPKYLSASVRSYLSYLLYSENATDYWTLSYH